MSSEAIESIADIIYWIAIDRGGYSLCSLHTLGRIV